MKKKQYNIIWGDDQINEILTDDLKGFLRELRIVVINESTNAEDLGAFLKLYADEVDAVITDANYSRDKDHKVDPDPNSELITSGLQYVFTLSEMYPEKPFYICTQRKPENLRKRFNGGELDPFKGKIFDKTTEDYEIFFPEIVKDIEEMNSPAFVIRNRYKKELQIAANLDYKYEVNGQEHNSNAEHDILNWLVEDYNGHLGNTHNLFNQVRKIIEVLQRYLVARSIIPPYISITELTNFCSCDPNQLRGQTEYVIVGNRRMPIQRYYALSRNLKSYAHPAFSFIFRFLMEATQDGSHRASGLAHKIDEYTSVHNDRQHIFRSVLFALLEILNWCFEVTHDTKFKGHWYGDLYGQTVDISCDDNGNWYADKILLRPADAECEANIDLPVTIGVSTINKFGQTSASYPLFYPIPGLIDFVSKDRNGLFVFDSYIEQTDIHEGDKVKIISLKPKSSKSGDNIRIAHVQKISRPGEITGSSVTNIEEQNTNGILPLVRSNSEKTTLNELRESNGKRQCNNFEVSSSLVGTIAIVSKNMHDGFLTVGDDAIVDLPGIKEGEHILIQEIVECVNAPFKYKIVKAMQTFENQLKKIHRDNDGNWYVENALVKPSVVKSIDCAPTEKIILGKVGINKGVLRDKYPLIVRGMLVENKTIPVYPGYILNVKLHGNILTASNCMAEGDGIKDGSIVVVKDVISNVDSNTNSEYKVKLLVELYKDTVNEQSFDK